MSKAQQPDQLTLDAQAALDAGMSYGRYMAQKPPRTADSIIPAVRSARSEPGAIVYCGICGAAIDTSLTKRRKFCSDACCKVQHNRYMRRYRDGKPPE